MSRSLRVISLLVAFIILTSLYRPLPVLAQGEPSIIIVSRTSEGVLGNNESRLEAGRSISGDGRYVAFYSRASNLAPGDGNTSYDVFVHDHWTGVTTLVSANLEGQVGTLASYLPSISLDGRFVAFESRSDDFVADDNNNRYDIFIRDLALGTTIRASLSTAGEEGNQDSQWPSISGDGRYVAFKSTAWNLVPDDPGDLLDKIYVRDLHLGITTLVSVSSEGIPGDGRSYTPAISHDGRFVAFESYAKNLVPGDTNNHADIFVHDRQTGETTRVSVSSAGTQANGASGSPQISGDGRYVVFYSSASNLVAGDTNAATDIFRHDLLTGETTRLSLSSEGMQANANSLSPTITPDGRYVAFFSLATNLVPGASQGGRQVYLHDTQTGETTRISQTAEGVVGGADSYTPALSADARYVAFHSGATNLVPEKTSTHHDVFLVDRGPIDSGEEPAPTPLLLDEPQAGQLELYQSQAYSLQLESPADALVVRVTPGEGADSLRLMGRLGGWPYFGQSDPRADQPGASGAYDLVFEPAAAGEYLILVQAVSITPPAANYEIVAQVVTRHLSSFAPRSAGNAGSVTLHVTGAGLHRAVAARLEADGQPDLHSTALGVVSPAELWATFDLTGATPGDYALVLDMDDAYELRAGEALGVVPGAGGRLEARVIAPEVARPDRRYTVWVEYENVGDADLQAPLLIVSTSPARPLWLFGREPSPDGSVQILATNPSAPARVLPPGAAGRVPLTIRTDLAEGNIAVTLAVLEAADTPVDWEAYAPMLRPDVYTQDEWDALWPALQTVLGDTWADYLGALGSAATRLQLRGVNPADVHQLLALLIMQASGSPVSAIAGIVLDAETYAPLPEARVIALRQDQEVVRAESSAADGAFSVAFLPAGAYDLHVEGYIVTPTLTAIITEQVDASGVRILASPIPAETEPDPPLMRHSGPVTVDVEGTPHLVFAANGALYHSTHDGVAWSAAAPIPGAWGGDPALLYAPELIDSVDPGLFLLWRAGAANDAALWYAVAIPDGAGGWAWSDPVAYAGEPQAGTANPRVVLDADGVPLVAWQMLDYDDIAADTDLYYGHAPVDPLLLSWSEIRAVLLVDAPALLGDGTFVAPGSTVALTDAGEAVLLAVDPQSWSEGFAMAFSFRKQGTVPRWVPYVGGRNEVTFSASLAGLASAAGASASAGLGGEVSLFDKRGSGSIIGQVGAQWKLDTRACRFDLAQGSLASTVGLSGRIPVPQLTFTDPFFGAFHSEVGLEVGGSLGGTLIWTAQGGLWPDGEISGQGSLGPYGAIKLHDFAEGAISGAGNFGAKISAKGFAFEEFYFSAQAAAQMGPFKYAQVWRYPPEIEMPEGYAATLEDALVTVLSEGVQVTTTVTLEAKPGTTTVYAMPAVLADVASDLVDDGPPALALGSDGLIYLFWHRESQDLDVTLGNTLTYATYDGLGWSAPQALGGTLGLGRQPAAAQDSLGNLLVAWVRADADGWTMASDAQALLAAYMDAEIHYGVLQPDGTWSTPAALTGVTGHYRQLALHALPDGDVWATWLDLAGDEWPLYAARWDGATWSTPEMVATGRLEGAAAALDLSGQVTLIWEQGTDDPALNSSQASELYTASYDGATWSTPVALGVALLTPAGPESEGVSAASSGVGSYFRLDVTIPPSVCSPPDKPPDNPSELRPDEEPAVPPQPPSGVLSPVGARIVEVVRPLDPNDKLGPLGFEEPRWIGRDEPLHYTIRFENVITATAPAQEVVITDMLDSDLDWNSLVVTEVAFGDQVHPVVSGQGGAYLLVDIPDYRPEITQTWQVEVVVGLDYATGKLTAVFKTLDPATGDYPEDAMAGFLPPNDDAGRGEGRLSFAILPKPGLADGVEITNQAEIVFDTEAPIWTNVWRNTIVTPYDLTVHTVGQGSVLREPWRDQFFPGQVVTLTAVADPGWAFVGWSGDATGTDNPLELVIAGDTAITAVFRRQIWLPVITRGYAR